MRTSYYVLALALALLVESGPLVGNCTGLGTERCFSGMNICNEPFSTYVIFFSIFTFDSSPSSIVSLDALGVSLFDNASRLPFVFLLLSPFLSPATKLQANTSSSCWMPQCTNGMAVDPVVTAPACHTTPSLTITDPAVVVTTTPTPPATTTGPCWPLTVCMDGVMSCGNETLGWGGHVILSLPLIRNSQTDSI
jgi:hypothetical protein